MGHYCWCCRRTRRNEKFNNRGHRDHICRDCQKLPKSERVYRQAVADIDRTIDASGYIRRKRRREFERYLSHDNERVRAYAEQVRAHDRELRDEWRRMRELEEAEIERQIEEWEALEAADAESRSDDEASDTGGRFDPDAEIPY